MNPEKLYEIANMDFKNAGEYEKLNSHAVEKEVGEFLYYLVKLIKPKIIVETGSGFSTLLMANALSENKKGHIYSFDIDVNTARNRAANFKITDLEEYVTLISGTAKDKFKHLIHRDYPAKMAFMQNKIDFIFFDANHTYESVMEEYKVFKLFLKKGAYLAFHDSTHPKFINKVGKAIENICKETSTEKISFETEFGLTILKIL